MMNIQMKGDDFICLNQVSALVVVYCTVCCDILVLLRTIKKSYENLHGQIKS